MPVESVPVSNAPPPLGRAVASVPSSPQASQQRSAPRQQSYDYSKYLDDPDYTVERDASGKITSIKHKPVEYTSRDSYTQNTYFGRRKFGAEKSQYVPHEIIFKDGKPKEEIRQDIYSPAKVSKGASYQPYTTQKKTFTDGVLTGEETYKTSYGDRKRNVVPVSKKTYDTSGQLTKEVKSQSGLGYEWYEDVTTVKDGQYVTQRNPKISMINSRSDRTEGEQRLTSTGAVSVQSTTASPSFRKKSTKGGLDVGGITGSVGPRTKEFKPWTGPQNQQKQKNIAREAMLTKSAQPLLAKQAQFRAATLNIEKPTNLNNGLERTDGMGRGVDTPRPTNGNVPVSTESKAWSTLPGLSFTRSDSEGNLLVLESGKELGSYITQTATYQTVSGGLKLAAISAYDFGESIFTKGFKTTLDNAMIGAGERLPSPKQMKTFVDDSIIAVGKATPSPGEMKGMVDKGISFVGQYTPGPSGMKRFVDSAGSSLAKRTPSPYDVKSLVDASVTKVGSYTPRQRQAVNVPSAKSSFDQFASNVQQYVPSPKEMKTFVDNKISLVGSYTPSPKQVKQAVDTAPTKVANLVPSMKSVKGTVDSWRDDSDVQFAREQLPVIAGVTAAVAFAPQLATPALFAGVGAAGYNIYQAEPGRERDVAIIDLAAPVLLGAAGRRVSRNPRVKLARSRLVRQYGEKSPEVRDFDLAYKRAFEELPRYIKPSKEFDASITEAGAANPEAARLANVAIYKYKPNIIGTTVIPPQTSLKLTPRGLAGDIDMSKAPKALADELYTGLQRAGVPSAYGQTTFAGKPKYHVTISADEFVNAATTNQPFYQQIKPTMGTFDYTPFAFVRTEQGVPIASIRDQMRVKFWAAYVTQDPVRNVETAKLFYTDPDRFASVSKGTRAKDVIDVIGIKRGTDYMFEEGKFIGQRTTPALKPNLRAVGDYSTATGVSPTTTARIAGSDAYYPTGRGPTIRPYDTEGYVTPGRGITSRAIKSAKSEAYPTGSRYPTAASYPEGAYAGIAARYQYRAPQRYVLPRYKSPYPSAYKGSYRVPRGGYPTDYPTRYTTPYTPTYPTRYPTPYTPNYPTRYTTPYTPGYPYKTTTPYNPYTSTQYRRDERRRDSDKRPRLTQGFNVLVRRRGEWLQVNTRQLTESQALGLGARYVEASPAATFKIQSTRQLIRAPGKVDPFYRQRRERFYTRTNRRGETLRIEKSRYRISSAGELAGITFKGIATARSRRSSPSGKLNNPILQNIGRGIFGR